MFLAPTTPCFTDNIKNLKVVQAYEGVDLSWDGGIGSEQYVIYVSTTPKVSKTNYTARILTNSNPRYEKLSSYIGSMLYFKVSQIKTCDGKTEEGKLSNEESIELLCGPKFDNLQASFNVGDPINLVDVTIPALPNNYPSVDSMDIEISQSSDFTVILDSTTLNSVQVSALPTVVILSTSGISSDTLYIRTVVSISGSSVLCSTFGHPMIMYTTP